MAAGGGGALPHAPAAGLLIPSLPPLCVQCQTTDMQGTVTVSAMLPLVHVAIAASRAPPLHQASFPSPHRLQPHSHHVFLKLAAPAGAPAAATDEAWWPESVDK